MDHPGDRILLPMRFDVQRMHEDLNLLESADWRRHFLREVYEGDWSVIPLRGPAGETHPTRMAHSDPGCTDFADTRFLENLRYFPAVLETFRCPLLSARLLKLSPGSRIAEHTDFDLSVEFERARLHIPVHTNEDVHFCLNGTRVILNEGECWYLRLSDPHTVENRGMTDRVHLAIDVTVNAWLKERLLSG